MDVIGDTGSAILDYQIHAVMVFVKVKIGNNLWKARFMTHVKSCPDGSNRANSSNQASKSGKKTCWITHRGNAPYRPSPWNNQRYLCRHICKQVGLEFVDNAVASYR